MLIALLHHPTMELSGDEKTRVRQPGTALFIRLILSELPTTDRSDAETVGRFLVLTCGLAVHFRLARD